MYVSKTEDDEIYRKVYLKDFKMCGVAMENIR